MRRWWSSLSESVRSAVIVVGILLGFLLFGLSVCEVRRATIVTDFRGAWAEMQFEGEWQRPTVFCDREPPYPVGTHVLAYRVRGKHEWYLLTPIP